MSYARSGRAQRWHRVPLALAAAMFAVMAHAGGQFALTGEMSSPRALHGGVLLPTGKVLIVGGLADFGVQVSTAELYDPDTGRFSPTGAPIDVRMRPTMVRLADGRVLVLGGRGGDQGDTYFATAEIYDSATGEFTPTGAMSVPRYVASAALLADGKVLVAAGFNREDGPLATAELYDPEKGKFEATGGLSVVRTEPNAVVRLLDGRVLIAGGSNEDGPIASAEIYDPVSGTFSMAHDMLHAIEDHAAALLPDGKVLIVGGSDGGGTGFPIYYADAELFDPATGAFTATGNLSFPREFTTASLLPGGRVLIAGGFHTGEAGQGVVGEAEIYDPASGKFLDGGHLAAPLDEPVAVVLQDQRVLLAGGFDAVNDLPTATAELFTPNAVDAIFADGFDTVRR